MSKKNIYRQSFTFSMKPESMQFLNRIANEVNLPKSRIVENMIIDKYKSLFPTQNLFKNEH